MFSCGGPGPSVAAPLLPNGPTPLLPNVVPLLPSVAVPLLPYMFAANTLSPLPAWRIAMMMMTVEGRA